MTLNDLAFVLTALGVTAGLLGTGVAGYVLLSGKWRKYARRHRAAMRALYPPENEDLD